MKTTTICSVLALALVFNACNQLSGNKAAGSENVPDISSKDDANKIIEYTNALVDVVKKYNESAKENMNYYDQLADKMNGKRDYIIGGNSSANFLFTVNRQAAIAFAEPTSALGDDKKFFEDSMGLYRKLYDTFKDNDSTLNIYVKAEDYKDDDFVKGKSIIDQQYNIYPQLVRLRGNIGKKIDIVADAAEEVSLSDSPIKEAYKAAKTDLGKFEELANTMLDKAENEKYSDTEIAAIETKYNDLLSSIEKNKNIDKSNLEKENKADSYMRFYKYMTEKSAELKPIIRNIKGSKTLSNNDYEDINRKYNSIISDYNSWVNY
jgi:hypothetical protein